MIGTILAVMLAMTFGFSAVAACATGIYVIGSFALLATIPRQPASDA